MNGRAARTAGVARARARSAQLPGQVVLVLQGGGAIGAYQVGVYQALHEAGIEPDWVIGTSIGAINGALLAGNPPARNERLGADHVMASGALPPAFPAIRLDGEDPMKDIDFTPAGVRARWRSGLDDTRAMIDRAPWRGAFDPMEAVIEHVAPERQRSAPSASQRPA